MKLYTPPKGPTAITAANGLLIFNQEVRALTVLPELLYLDAITWFSHMSLVHQNMADEGARDGDEEFAIDMREVSEQIQRLLAAGVYFHQKGLWPQVENRAKLPEWRITSFTNATSYFKYLLDNPTVPTCKDCHFILEISCRSITLKVTEELSGSTRFAAPFQSEILDSTTMDMQARALVPDLNFSIA